MAMSFLVGVDLGTTATKAALYRGDGTLVAEESAEVPLYYPRSGSVEQDNDDFYSTAALAVRRCIQSSGIDAKEIAAVALDSQMAGIGSIDEEFNPAARFDSWLDMRCQPYIEELERAHGNLITRTTGCPPTCDHGPKILWWKEEQPEDYRRIAKFVTPVGYVAGTMAGLRADEAFIDYTFIHFSGLSDAQRGTWSQELCEVLGVDQGKLPRIVQPWDVVGEVTPKAASDFGLEPGTPIAAGAGDTAAGALGSGIVRSGMLLDTAGTASVLSACTEQFAADEKNRAVIMTRSVIPGLWSPLAYVAGGGLALRWFRDTFHCDGSVGSSEASGKITYESMIEAAAGVAPGAEGLFFCPHLGGRICPAAPEMRGAWVGFSWGHTKAHFCRAILESVAYEYAYYARIIRELVPDISFTETRVIGGGSASTQWNQIKADVLGVPYQRMKRRESATWGSALIAGHAVGLFNDLAEQALRSSELEGDAIMPRAEMTQEYRSLVEDYTGWQQTPQAVRKGHEHDA